MVFVGQEDVEYEDEEYAEGEPQEPSTEAPPSSTEGKKLVAGGVRPFRSNTDLLAALKRRRAQAAEGTVIYLPDDILQSQHFVTLFVDPRSSDKINHWAIIRNQALGCSEPVISYNLVEWPQISVVCKDLGASNFDRFASLINNLTDCWCW